MIRKNKKKKLINSKKNILFYFLVFLSFFVNSQVVFDQGVVKGGVSAAGFSTGMSSGSGAFNVFIEPGSTIKKAYIFTYRIGFPPPATFIFNGSPFVFDTTKMIMSVTHTNPFATPINLYYLDVTSDVNPNTINNTITIPDQFGLPINWGYWTFFLFIVYENPSLPNTAYSIMINNQNYIGNEMYSVSNLNIIDTDFPVGFSLYSDRSENGLPPLKQVFFNSNLLGTLGGSDNINNIWQFAGVKGHFYYQNNQLYGLDDDTPDFFMDSTDGLADVSYLTSNNATICNFKLTHNYFPNQAANLTNINLAFFLAYSTPCHPFNVTTPSDTTICVNSPLQLLATGGTSTGSLPAYEWQPATGLSCTDCPNPVFTSDSSMFYTVRIRSNDSCSVVRPLKINVRPQPVFSENLTTKSECFGTTGSITATSQALGASYSLDGGAVQSSGFFGNLAAGDYLLTLHDVNGCTKDTLITIEDTLTISAQFAVNPSSGAAPLTVQITNQSQHATDYEWFLNGTSTGSATVQNYTFDTSGVYEIMLYAWQNSPSCIDSFSISIQVYDSLMVEIPNVFTPNNDGINEAFGVTVNIPAEVKYRIFNRWGNEMKAGTISTTPGVFVPIWSGNNASEGVYFYKLEVRDLSMSSPSVPLPKGEDEIYVIFNGFFELRK